MIAESKASSYFAPSPIPFDEKSETPEDDLSVESTMSKGGQQKQTPKERNWLTKLIVSKEELAVGLFGTKWGTENSSGVALEDDRLEALTDERDDLTEGREFHDTTTASWEDESESVLAAAFDDENDQGCTSNPAKCEVDLPDKEDFKHEFAEWQTTCAPHMANQGGRPIMDRRDDGIDFIFELVESAMCGEFNYRRRNGTKPGITVEDLPSYNMPPRATSIEEDESIHSTRSRRSASARSRSTTKSSRKRRSRPPKSKRRSSSKSSEPKINEKIAKAASAFILENVEATDEHERCSDDRSGQSEKLKSSLRVSTPNADKCSAFEDCSTGKMHASNTTASTAVSSHVTESTQTVSAMRELCVLSIGSGSSVSSFQNDAHSWSHHDKREVTNKGVLKTISLLTDFFSSLSADIQGIGAIPVNKTACLVALVLIVLFWPEDREKDRVQIARTDPPKQASLLTLVTNRDQSS